VFFFFILEYLLIYILYQAEFERTVVVTVYTLF